MRNNQFINKIGYQLKAGYNQELPVRPELAEGWAGMPFMVRQAYHERLDPPRLKLVAKKTSRSKFEGLCWHRQT